MVTFEQWYIPSTQERIQRLDAHPNETIWKAARFMAHKSMDTRIFKEWWYGGGEYETEQAEWPEKHIWEAAQRSA